jgi:hypothetical protein
VDQIGSLAGGLHPKPTDFGQDVGRSGRLIVPRGSLDDCQEFALQRPVMPYRPLPQSLHDVVRGVLDREIYWQGSIFSFKM